MRDPIYTIIKSDPFIVDYFAGGPIRIYSFGDTPEGTPTPYTTWQLISGDIQNNLGDKASGTQGLYQIDVYSKTSVEASDLRRLLFNALDNNTLNPGLSTTVNNERNHPRDKDTRNFRASLEINVCIDYNTFV